MRAFMMTVLITLVPGMTVAQTFDELSNHVKSGDSVYVIDTQGRTTRGKLVTVSSDSLELKTQSNQITFSPAQAQQVYVGIRDSRMNGTLIGLGVGAATGALAAGLDSPNCSGATQDFFFRGCTDFLLDDGTMMMGAALLFGGIGAVVGYIVDGAREGRRLVYGSPRVSIVPHVSGTSIGAFLMIRP